MSSIIKFKVINGAGDDGPLSYLLQIDEYRFLLDCGWNEKCSPEILEQYKAHVKTVDAVLLSYPDINHLGALPYLISQMNLSCEIYCTVPVYKMGQMFLYDLYLSKTENEEFSTFNLDDIDITFDKIKPVKYSQTINLKGRGQGLQITALPGGHMIGGTIWKILKDGEEEIIYAVDYNHNRERHLNSCVMDSINKPTLLITDSYNFLQNQAKRRSKDEKLLECMFKTFRGDGNILLCTDTAGRMLELAFFLESLWNNPSSSLYTYPIALLTHVSLSTIELAKSQVEWMNDKIVQTFEQGRSNPFEFKHIKLCRSIDELNSLRNHVAKNKLVLVSQSDLESGYGRSLFLDWCENSKNAVIFTSRPTPGTLAHNLLENYNTKKNMMVEVSKRVKLEGEELEEYYRKQFEKEREEQDRIKKSKELESIDESSSSDEEDETNAMNIVGSNVPSGKHDLMKLQTKNRFFKQNKKQFIMFPYKEEQIKWDDYGEFVKVDELIKTTENQSDNVDTEMTTAENMETDASEAAAAAVAAAALIEDETPTKCISEVRELNIRSRLYYIDYSGRSDGESVKKILSSIKPKNLIIVHGSEKSTKDMLDFCQNQKIVQNRIFTPRQNEMVNATLETQIYNVKLKDELVSSLKFKKVKDYELAWVDAVIKYSGTGNEAVNERQQPNPELGFSLHPMNKEDVKEHKTVFVNEPKLSDLKQIFLHNSIQAEFHGGVLVCNGIVALKKNQAGRIVLEGVVSDDYYKVRKILYEQYALL